jgi:hypothetical protein
VQVPSHERLRVDAALLLQVCQLVIDVHLMLHAALQRSPQAPATLQ